MTDCLHENVSRGQTRGPRRRQWSAALVALVASLWMPFVLGQGRSVDMPADESVAGAEDSDGLAKEATGTVHFGFGAIAADSWSSLDDIIARILQDDRLQVRIAAHTDNRGWSLGNVELSRLRARAVARELVARGVTLERISARAYGESNPVAPNATAEGRQRNRRAEIVLSR